jgi:glyoxylase-like metal-dependent hydrolase (beta-lactamase superfamily II)
MARRTVWRVGLAVAGLLLAVGVMVVFAVAEMFVGLRPVEDGAEVNGVRIVADGFTTIAVAPSGADTVVLIDAGMDATGAAILAELARRGLGPDAVSAVFITHGHGDHIGALGLFPAAAVYALEAEVPLIEGRASPTSPMGRVMPSAPTGFTVTETLADGDEVVVGDVTVRVYAVPGHTAGSAAYLVNGVLFLGDSGQVEASGELRPAPWLVTDDRAQNRASLRALAARLAAADEGVAAVVPSHSGPANGRELLEAFAVATPD